MKHEIKLAILIASLISLFTNCTLKDDTSGGPNDSFSVTGGPTGSVYAGTTFSFMGDVSLLNAGALATSAAAVTGDFSFVTDSACSVPASGTTTGLDSSVLLAAGTFSFAENNLTYTDAHGEPKLYLQVAFPVYSAAVCSPNYIQILQHFVTGVGFVNFQDGGTGAANAPAVSKWDTPIAIAHDSQNRLVMVGYSLNTVGRYEMAIWRYEPDGTLDTSFATAGFLTFKPGGIGVAGATNATKTDIGSAMAITSTDKIVVAGQSKNGAGGSELALWRYNSDGTIDNSFGTSGVVLFQHNGTGAAGSAKATKQDSVNGLLVDSSGNYLIAGTSMNSAGGLEPVLWRYLPNGTLDTTFGSSTGFVIFEHGLASLGGATNATKKDSIQQTAQATDGGYVVAGASAGAGTSLTTFWKTTSDGTADAAFGTAGALVINAGAAGPGGAVLGSRIDSAQAIAVNSAGKFIAALSSNTAGATNEAILVKFDATGTLDATYGAGNGIAVLTNGGNSFAGGSLNDVPQSLSLDSSGNAVFSVNSSSAAGDHEPVIVRATSAGALDITLNGQGWIDYAQAGITGPGGATVGSKFDGNAKPTIDGNVFALPQIPLLIDDGGRYLFAFSAATVSPNTFELSLSRFLSTGTLDQ